MEAGLFCSLSSTAPKIKQLGFRGRARVQIYWHETMGPLIFLASWQKCVPCATRLGSNVGKACAGRRIGDPDDMLALRTLDLAASVAGINTPAVAQQSKFCC